MIFPIQTFAPHEVQSGDRAELRKNKRSDAGKNANRAFQPEFANAKSAGYGMRYDAVF
jgi:hypothetical protein